MDIKDISKLLASVSEADINELTLETGDYKLVVKRGQETVMVQAPVMQQLSHEVIQQPQQITQLPAVAPAPVVEEPVASPEVAAPVEAAKPGVVLTEVNAPIVGTFYSSASPDSPPFVKEGDKVQAGQVLCIIEAMKLMNEIEADVSGTIAEILVRNEEAVEYGQVIFTIDPS